MSKRRALWLVAGAALLTLAGLFVASVPSPSPNAPQAGPAAPSYRARAELTVAESIYAGGLADGWQDWGWGKHDFPDGGAARIVFEGYGGLVLRHEPLPARFGGVVFQYRAPPAWGEFLEVALLSEQRDAKLPGVRLEPRHVALLADGWREAFVGMNELNPERVPFDRVVIKALRSVGPEWVSIDGVSLTKLDPQASPDAGTRAVTLRIRCEESATSISPLIYGIAHGVWTSGETAHRVGGNPMTRLNWDIGNVWNTGSDWFFENVGGDGPGLFDWLDEAAGNGVEMALVVPMIGWVAKDATSVGFPRAKFPKQQKFDPHRPEAGNGLDPEGKPVRPGPPTQTSVAAPPELIGRWVERLREKDAARGQRGVHYYILDNEPSLWNHTHRDVHPEPVSYDELLDRTIRYASQIRKADPEAVIAGPAEWGWTSYFYSAKDQVLGTVLRPDRRLHGDVPLVPWYLRRLAEHEKKSGVRLLDVLILHYYPVADGIYGSGERTDPQTAAQRIRSTRSLWDPDYTDESWIDDQVRLIPRMKEWVRDNYPGLKVAIGEWSFGAEGHISGGLATAEALGRFAEQGLDAAFYWVGPKPETPTYWAFRAYRNYDGAGGRFQDWSVPTESAPGVSLFASRNREGTRVVAVLLNLDPELAIEATVDVSSCGLTKGRRVFGFTRTSTALVEEPAASAPADATPGPIDKLPPYSFKVLEFSLAPKP